MSTLAAQLETTNEAEKQQARADYARITKAPRQLRADIDRLVRVRQLLGISTADVAADGEALTAYKIAMAKVRTADVHRLALKALAPQLRAAKAMSTRPMSRRQREETIYAVGKLVTKHEGGLRQAQDAAKRLIELQAAHPFLTW